ncbi:MAG: hypothetical protein PWP58_363 [Bacillota bacterium]|nr:hypothetical protein [Bacillota bacterium]
MVRPCRGGIATHIRVLVRQLKKDGQEVFVAAPNDALAQDSDGYFRLPLSRHPVDIARSAEILEGLLPKLEPDVVHCHGILSSLLKPFLSRQGNEEAAWIYTAHNFPSSFFSQLAWRWAYTSGRPHRLIAVSRALAGALTRCGIPAPKVIAIPNGIEIRPEPPDAAVLPAGSTILTVGRLVPEKGTGQVLKAFQALKKQVRKPLRLLVAGTGPQEKALQALAGRLGIGRDVTFLGYVPDPAHLYRAADVFVTAPLREGMGLANLEAMARGCPVVSTRVGGIPEVVVDGVTGFLVEPNRPLMLAQAIKKLLDSPALARSLGLAGARRVREHFTAEGMGRATLKVYEEAKMSASS